MLSELLVRGAVAANDRRFNWNLICSFWRAGHWSIIILLYAVIFLALDSQKLHSQTATTGGLTGVVTDSSGALLRGAIITLQDNAKGTVASSSTNAAGVYLFPFLPPSIYTITTVHPGFRSGLSEPGQPDEPKPELALHIVVPEEFAGMSMGELRSRRGSVTSMDVRSGTVVIRASLSVSEYEGLAEAIRVGSQGRGRVEPVPSQ